MFTVIFRVYCADHTFCTLRFPIYSTAEVIKICAADKLQLNRGPDDLALVEVKSNGERTIFKDNDLSIPTALTLNGRLFISPRDHLDALTALPEQEGATEGLDVDIETLATKDLGYHMTLFDWDLFWAVHEYELLYHTFGRHHFNKVSILNSYRNCQVEERRERESFDEGTTISFLTLIDNNLPRKQTNKEEERQR